ncbi:MAG TPA: acetate--CoA ligase family protein [Phycisphaerae bacterium]|nr:acetate--CoA ligase family protein [Phycisphaerae bacterium]HNU44620.1 acetate--CoA ligase family protein [Phycisphaerae bacterium]
MEVYQSGRRLLFEHEVYRLLELVGAVAPPRYYFVQKGEQITAQTLDCFPGDKVVLKVVSPDIAHKSDVGGVVFAPKDIETVNREIRQLVEAQGAGGARVAGVLVVEYVQRTDAGFGQELFIGIRSTREFGPIIAAGLGGIHTEYLAAKMKPGQAVAKALAVDTTPEQFMELFQKTAAYDVLAGRARGRQRIVSDGDLLRCFRAFIAVARRFCVDRGEEGPDVQEIEVNPFAFSRLRMIPLDGHGALATATKALPARPATKIEALVEPRSIALVGVSTKRANFGRIILKNLLDCGFPKDRLFVVREGEKEIDGVGCVPSIAALPGKVDLLVVATGAEAIPDVMQQTIDSRKIASVILIPGGMGETEGTQGLEAKVREMIVASRQQPDGGPIVLGGNCMGVRSRPGHYDTFFIPPHKLDPRRHVPPRRAALISQSGAFIISRMSNLEALDPTIAISLGNQIDATVSDMLRAVGDRDDMDCIGVYVEGFNPLDGLAFVRSVQEVTAAGKVVVFYKAGRTDPGRAATAGHTASVAGDYDVCQTAVANAGAIVTDTFKEFEQVLELATALHGKEVGGVRIGAISNAGFETVGMADNIHGARFEAELPALSEATARRVAERLAKFKLDGLVNVRNPLDMTPMANEDAFEACIRAFIEDPGTDAVLVGFVPLTPQMLTTEEEIAKPGSLADRLPALLAESRKPVVAVIDSGRPYDAFARRLRDGAVPVFRTCDEAMRSLGRYLAHRWERSRTQAHQQSASPTRRVQAAV